MNDFYCGAAISGVLLAAITGSFEPLMVSGGLISFLCLIVKISELKL